MSKSGPINILSRDVHGIVSVKNFKIEGAEDPELDEVTLKEIRLGESLLTPGLQTAVTMQSAMYVTNKVKMYEKFKNKDVSFTLRIDYGEGEAEKKEGFELPVQQKVYRLDNRFFMPVNIGQSEEFTVHACDISLLNDAKSLVSKSWKCTKPSEIVSYVLKNCVGVQNPKVDSADPARDYIAENIHPFQVVAQQANVALDGGDPSFLHYMTYEDKGTHYFRSLKKLSQGQSVATFKYGETGTADVKTAQDDPGAGGGYQNPNIAISFNFPCDFDYLTDLLNGVDEQGQNQNTLMTNNPVLKGFHQSGNQSSGCGMGGYNSKEAISNKDSAQQQNSCNLDVETHLLKRQARMALLERDKIALRILIPWNPKLHVGQVITLDWKHKLLNEKMYGAGDYIISALIHNIRFGGFSTTCLDCVSTTVGKGQT